MQNTKSCILVIDFGSQYTQLLLKSIRELGVYSKLCDWKNVNKLNLYKLNPSGIILSGGPYSVTEKDMPSVPEFVFKLGIPVLGICYGMQVMTVQLGGSVENSENQREFGSAQVEIFVKSTLIDGIYDHINDKGNLILDVWMSHGDRVLEVPKGFIIVGMTKYNEISIMMHKVYPLFGVQFHPEVTHTTKGKNILERFIIGICCCPILWKSANIVDSIVENIRETIGKDKVILAFSGGVDSIVTALLLKRAIGNQFVCIFINNGLLCHSELNRVHKIDKKNYDLNIIFVSEEQRFLNALVGVIDPEKKRKIIGKTFIEILEMQMNFQKAQWLAQGTIYSDVIESGISPFFSANIIKSHHNVGGLPEVMNLQLLEPIKNLFKDEVRKIGLYLGLSKDVIYRHPIPGPGMAIRILGEVKEKYCDILRQADSIFIEELKNDGLYSQISQAFAVFLPIYSVGIQGDRRKYQWVVALRAIETIDFMTARWARLPYDFLNKVSIRIVNEVKGISRVVYDISSKPPATVEWE